MPDLTPAHVAELRRLTVLLDHPHEVARAAGHRVNTAHYSPHGSPRRFPACILETYAATYTRLLYLALAGLLDSPPYRALPDWRRRHAIRDAQAAIATATDRALWSRLRASALVVSWAPLVATDDDAGVAA